MSQQSRKTDEWKELLRQGPFLDPEANHKVMQEMLTYIIGLELELLSNSPYRVGKSFPGRRSIEGIALVLIIRRALAVIKFLGQGMTEEQQKVPGLIFALASLAGALQDADVMAIDDEPVQGKAHGTERRGYTGKRSRIRRR